MVGGDSPGNEKNARIDFELYEGNVEDLPPRYQGVNFHIIFDVKMGDNFLSKYQMASGGHKTKKLYSLNYSPVISQDSVRIS